MKIIYSAASLKINQFIHKLERINFVLIKLWGKNAIFHTVLSTVSNKLKSL